MVEVTVLAALPGVAETRLHIVRDPNPMATLFSSLDGFELYNMGDNLWLKLEEGDPPLWAGSPSTEGLKAHLQFYVSGQPTLTSDPFRKAFSHAEARINQAIGTDMSYLWVDFDDQWNPLVHKAGGMSVQVGSGEKTAYVDALYSVSDPELSYDNVVRELGSAFEQWFALPGSSLTKTEAHEWGFINHIWYAEWASG